MALNLHVKFCGLQNVGDVSAAVSAGARYVGFVFFEKSPRNVSLQQAAPLALEVPLGLCKVALTVNADDAFLDALTDAVAVDMLQLHGSETPARVTEVKQRYGLPVMKAVGIAQAEDLAQLDAYMDVAKGSALPGGNGLAFDWRLLAGRSWPKPWMLAGGLTPENVAEAARMTGARQVDVSSGVETRPGVKDAGLIAAFGKAAKV